MTRILRPSLTRRAALGGLVTLPALLSRAAAAEPGSVASAFTKPRAPITSPEQAMNVMDFEALARDALPPAHFGYIATGVDHDGIVVSNHGGRNEETLRATVDCLAEVIAAARKRVPVFLDGGVRRGTDVFKALALGAAGVGIGRPQAWGLAAFGQSGVEAVLNIFDTELTNIMRQAGTPTIAAITGAHVIRR